MKRSEKKMKENAEKLNPSITDRTLEELQADKILNNNLNVQEKIELEKNTLFNEIQEYIDDDNITDIEWDGDNLWITDLTKGCYMSDKKLDDGYIDNLSIRLANIMKTRFNRSAPILEANTDKLRISIWHESRCGKKSVTIRKVPLFVRFNHESLVESNYAPEPIINLLENCIIAHMNCVYGGQPHAGKTELLKYMTKFIPYNEKAGVYEDNQEIHYKQINPNKKSVEFYIDDKTTYADIIKGGLRHNIDWILLSESRGPEVIELINALSTGSYCLTTMHLQNVRRLPDRMYNMVGSSQVSDRFINNVYKYINVGVLIHCDKNQKRHIKQVAFYTRENLKNECHVIYEDGEMMLDNIPKSVIKRFNEYGINDPTARNYVENPMLSTNNEEV